MSETNHRESAENNELKKNNYYIWQQNKYDIGEKILKERRDQVTYAGKYSERYKNFNSINSAYSNMYSTTTTIKSSADENCNDSPQSAQNLEKAFSRNHNLNTSKLAHQTDSNFSPNVCNKQNSLPTSPKFNHKQSPSFTRKQPISPNFKINKKSFKTKEPGSNATNDLNNSQNLSQLTSFKIKKPVDYTEINYLTVPCTKSDKDQNSFDTLTTLQGIANCIAVHEEKHKISENVDKFDEFLKKRWNAQNESANILQNKEKSQNFNYNELNQKPLKSFNEVENLLRPGVSNLEAEKIADKRHSDLENPTHHKKRHAVLRTTSDVQDKCRKQLEKYLPRPRSKQSKVFILIFKPYK